MRFAHTAALSFCLLGHSSVVFAQVRKIEIIDSTRIVFRCDTLNEIDDEGRAHGMWLEWSSTVEYIQSNVEHIQDDQGGIHGIMSSHKYIPRIIYDFRIEGNGQYQHGVRYGQWLWYDNNGTIEWIRTYGDNGRLLSVTKLSSTGIVELVAMSDPLSADGLLKVLRFDEDGQSAESQWVEPSVLDAASR